MRSAPASACCRAGERVADRPDPSADAVARLDDRDGRAARLELARRAQARQARARDDDSHAVQIPLDHR